MSIAGNMNCVNGRLQEGRWCPTFRLQRGDWAKCCYVIGKYINIYEHSTFSPKINIYHGMLGKAKCYVG